MIQLCFLNKVIISVLFCSSFYHIYSKHDELRNCGVLFKSGVNYPRFFLFSIPKVFLNTFSEVYNLFGNHSVIKSNSDVEVRDCCFCRCITSLYRDGSAIYVEKCNSRVNSCIFIECHAESSAAGICSRFSNSFESSKNAFVMNYAGFSSASMMFFTTFEISISDSNFSLESSRKKAGSVSFFSSWEMKLKNLIFHNISSIEGPAVLVDSGNISMIGVGFAHSTTLHHFQGVSYAHAMVKDCMFSACRSLSISWESCGKIIVDHSVFSRELSKELSSNNQSTIMGNNAFYKNPSIETPLPIHTPAPPTPTPLQTRTPIFILQPVSIEVPFIPPPSLTRSPTPSRYITQLIRKQPEKKGNTVDILIKTVGSVTLITFIIAIVMRKKKVEKKTLPIPYNKIETVFDD